MDPVQCYIISQPFSRAQQFTAVVSVHIMIDFSKFVSFNSLPGDDYNNENDMCFHY